MAFICTSKLYVHIHQMYDHKQVCYCVQCPRANGNWVSGTSGAPFYVLMSLCMMTSSNGNIFRVTGPLCGEFTGPHEFPTQRPVTRSFDVCFALRLNKRLSKQPWGWWFETPSWSLWRQCNGKVTSKYNDGILEWNTEWQINKIYTLYKGGMRWVRGRVGSGGINHKSTNGTAGSGFHHKYCVSIADNIDMRWKTSYLSKCFGRTCLYIFFQWFLFDINCISYWKHHRFIKYISHIWVAWDGIHCS